MNDVGTRTLKSLEFLIRSIKMVTPLTYENYLTWSTQIFKLFQENAFDQFLDKNIPPPPRFLPAEANSVSPNPNPSYPSWKMVDQNLTAAIYFTISTPLLYSIVNLETLADIWISLSRRFRATSLLHLYNQHYHLTMKYRPVMQYRSDIKGFADLLCAAGSPVSDEVLISYVLNGLPSSYQAFKTSILTRLEPLPLEDFFSLLSCEEFHLENDCERKMEDHFDVNLSSRRSEESRAELLPQVKTLCVAVGARIAGIFGKYVKLFLEERVFAFWLIATGFLVGVVAAFFAM